MGNRLTSFNEEKEYQEFEGILLAVAVWIGLSILVIASCLLAIRHFGNDKLKNFVFCQSHVCTVEGCSVVDCSVVGCSVVVCSVVVYILTILVIVGFFPIILVITFLIGLVILIILTFRYKTFLSKNAAKFMKLKEDIHSALMALFPELITKKVLTENLPTSNDLVVVENTHPKQSGHLAISMEENVETEVYLFGDKEFNKNTTSCVISCLPFSLIHAFTYLYFILVIFLAFFWFIAMVIENGIYRKTTTCNDIDVKDNSFTCFNVESQFNPTAIDCSAAIHTNIEVFCYLYQPNFAAFGVGFSIFKLIIFSVTVSFKVAIKIAESQCGQVLLLFVQILLLLVSLVALPSILSAVHFTATLEIYFFHGNAVIRWVMFVLIILTALLLIPVPWCGFTQKTIYKNMALKKQHAIKKAGSTSEEADKEETGSMSIEVDKERAGSMSEEADKEEAGSMSIEVDKERAGSMSEEADKERAGSTSEEADKEEAGSMSEEADKEKAGSTSKEADKEKAGSTSEEADKEKAGSTTKTLAKSTS
jgi:hypothetical protein